MKPSGEFKVKALHPDWVGTLSLSQGNNGVRHDLQGNRGTYTIKGPTLTVEWDKYPAETFLQIGAIYVHERMLNKLPRLHDLLAVSLRDSCFEAKTISIAIPKFNYDVTLRLGTTDVPTFEQIFIRNEYDSPHLPDDAQTILDLGANIGLSAVFFGTRFPSARIAAVEPDAGNYSVLLRNVEALGDRVSALKAAAWSDDGVLESETEDAEGNVLEAWGLRVSRKEGNLSNPTKCCGIETLMQLFDLQQVDILKVDIEGAELEVFSKNSAQWLQRVRLILIETHDRFRAGSEAAVRAALARDFIELPRVGENLVFRRTQPTP